MAIYARVMTQEEKNLLLKDLCARLPYGVIVKFEVDTSYDTAFESVYQTSYFDGELLSLNVGTEEVELSIISNDRNTIDYIDELLIAQPVTFTERIPYLFPLSSMTEGKKKEYYNLCIEEEREEMEFGEWITRVYYHNTTEAIDWLNKNHFDYRGLIKKGLAIDCTNLDIY